MVSLIEPVCGKCGSRHALITRIGAVEPVRWFCGMCALDETLEKSGDWLGRCVFSGVVVPAGRKLHAVQDPPPDEEELPPGVRYAHDPVRVMPWGDFVYKEDAVIPWYTVLELERPEEMTAREGVVHVTQDSNYIDIVNEEEKIAVPVAAGFLSRKTPPPGVALGIFATKEEAVAVARLHGFAVPAGETPHGVKFAFGGVEGPYQRIPVQAFIYAEAIEPAAAMYARCNRPAVARRMADDAYKRGYRLCGVGAYIEEGDPTVYVADILNE